MTEEDLHILAREVLDSIENKRDYESEERVVMDILRRQIMQMNCGGCLWQNTRTL